MGFLIFTIPMIVVCLILFGLQKAALFLLQYSAVINAAVAVLLAVNLVLMVLLLRVWLRWRRTGKLKWEYRSRFTSDWKRVGIELIQTFLLPAAVWEGLVTLLCALYLIIQPLQYLPPF